MNITEQKAKVWLEKDGKTVVFQGRRNPDFIDSVGNGYEVKLLRNNSIIFSRSQFEELKTYAGVKVVIYDSDGDEPAFTVPFQEIVDSGKYWRNIHIGVYEVPGGNTTVQLNLETKDRLASIGLKGETYDTIINRLLEKVVLN